MMRSEPSVSGAPAETGFAQFCGNSLHARVISSCERSSALWLDKQANGAHSKVAEEIQLVIDGRKGGQRDEGGRAAFTVWFEVLLDQRRVLSQRRVVDLRNLDDCASHVDSSEDCSEEDHAANIEPGLGKRSQRQTAFKVNAALSMRAPA